MHMCLWHHPMPSLALYGELRQETWSLSATCPWGAIWRCVSTPWAHKEVNIAFRNAWGGSSARRLLAFNHCGVFPAPSCWFSLNFILLIIIVCMHVWVKVCRHDHQRSVLSFHLRAGSGHQTQVTRLAQQDPLPVSRLPTPLFPSLSFSLLAFLASLSFVCSFLFLQYWAWSTLDTCSATEPYPQPSFYILVWDRV